MVTYAMSGMFLNFSVKCCVLLASIPMHAQGGNASTKNTKLKFALENNASSKQTWQFMLMMI